MVCDDPEYTYMAIDGVENCINALEDIKSGKMENCFVEMSACFGSCINGPAMDQGQRQPVQDFIAVNKYAGKRTLWCRSRLPKSSSTILIISACITSCGQHRD